MAIPPVDPARRSALFPEVVPAPPDRVFEIGLVLGGTVSAGAYTAGALDFLLEALEAWHGDPSLLHRVVIKTAAGTSGGAVCAAILGLLSSRPVPHMRQDPAPTSDGTNPAPTGNPLWDLWVNDFRIVRFLELNDLGQDADAGSGAVVSPVQHVPSLVNCRVIDESGAKLAQIGTTDSVSLGYFAAPFRIGITLANLRGIPYQIVDIPTYGNYTGAAFVQHDDFAWFAFPNGASPTVTADSLGKREDEFWLGGGAAGAGFVGYDVLVSYATASGAVPVGLAARALARPAEHYNYRPRVRPTTDAPGYRIDWPEPDWTGLPETQAQGTYSFTSVDGGTFNNDPVSLVHRALAGVVGVNPRGKSDAHRALLMIDPLADEPKPIGKVGKSLYSVVQNILGTVVGEARYLTADMELFASDTVFSRFQLVPFRSEGKVGEAALAGTSLYAAAGWCCRAFRVHDYLLGRKNMQDYLRRDLVLAGDNPLFDGWQLQHRQDWAMDEHGSRIDVRADTPKSSYYLPVVPDKTGGPLAEPDWPVDKYDPATLTPMLKARLQAVIDRLVKDNATGILPWFVEMFAVPGVVNLVSSRIVDGFKRELQEAGLLLGAKA